MNKLQKIILLNWFIIAISALLVGTYISIFESFVAGKAYLFFIIALVTGFVSYRKYKGK